MTHGQLKKCRPGAKQNCFGVNKGNKKKYLKTHIKDTTCNQLGCNSELKMSDERERHNCTNIPKWSQKWSSPYNKETVDVNIIFQPVKEFRYQKLSVTQHVMTHNCQAYPYTRIQQEEPEEREKYMHNMRKRGRKLILCLLQF